MPQPVTLIGLNYAPEPTGIAPYTTGAAEGLAAGGYQVLVVTGYPHYPQWKIAAGYSGWSLRQLIHGVRVLRLRHPVPESGNLIKRALMEVCFGVRSILTSWHRPAVALVISPALLSAALAVVRAKLTRTPVVLWVQDIYTLGVSQASSAGRTAGLLRAIESWTARNATRVIAIHDRFKHFLASELGVAPDRIDVVRNWTHVADGGVRSSEVRRRRGWPEDATVVLHAGNMGAKQNLENVVRASHLASSQGTRVHFVLLGDGHRREALQAMGDNPNLHWVAPLPDGEFEATLASADVLLVNELPGMTEMSVPSKLTSYFNTGLPVLAAVDSGSVTAEEIERSRGGIQVEPDDPQALLDGALRLAGDPGLAARLGAAGREYRTTVLGVATAIDGIAASLRAAQEHRGSR